LPAENKNVTQVDLAGPQKTTGYATGTKTDQANARRAGTFYCGSIFY